MEHPFLFSEKTSDYRLEALDDVVFFETASEAERTMNTTVFVDDAAETKAVHDQEIDLAYAFGNSNLVDELCEVIGYAHEADEDGDLTGAEFPFHSDTTEYTGITMRKLVGDRYQVVFSFAAEDTDSDGKSVERKYFIPYDELIKFIPNVELEDEEEWYPTILKRLADGSKKIIESALYQKASSDTKIAMLSAKEQKIFKNVHERYADKVVTVIPEEHYCTTKTDGEATSSLEYIDHKATQQPATELCGTIVDVRFLEFTATQEMPDANTPILVSPYPCLVLVPEKEDRAYLIPISSVLAIDVLRAQSQQ